MATVGPGSVGESVPWVRDFITQWADGTREGHRFAKESQEHADRMLTWTIGLMGAGILASKDFLAAAPVDLRFAAFLPWIAGIVSAVAGRLLGADLMQQTNLVHYERVHSMEMLLLVPEAAARAGIDRVLSGKDLKEKDADVRRRQRRTQACFYGAHVFLVLGIVAVVLVAYCTGRQ
jgi:hypothetical protein